VSNIPSTSISQALTPVARHTNDALRAKKVQSQKQSHHNEDVEELDDTAVNSVSEDSQQKGGNGKGKNASKQSGEDAEAAAEDRVDVQSLPASALPSPLKQKPKLNLPRLDISA